MTDFMAIVVRMHMTCKRVRRENNITCSSLKCIEEENTNLQKATLNEQMVSQCNIILALTNRTHVK
jgi:pimeloyl-CoA synthetase